MINFPVCLHIFFIFVIFIFFTQIIFLLYCYSGLSVIRFYCYFTHSKYFLKESFVVNAIFSLCGFSSKIDPSKYEIVNDRIRNTDISKMESTVYVELKHQISK